MESYVKNQNCYHVPYESVPNRLKSMATKNPDKTGFVFVSATDETRDCMTYGELYRKSELFGKGLKSLGVGQEDVIGIGDARIPETLVALFGVQMTGAIPILFRFSEKDWEDILNIGHTANCSALIVDRGHEDDDLKDIVESTGKMPRVKKLVFMRVPNSKHDFLTVKDVIELGAISREPLPEIDPDSTAVVLLTSGSIGTPKMVPYTHYSILIDGYYAGITLMTNDQSIMYNDRSFSWSGGFPFWEIFNGGCRVVTQNINCVKKVSDMNDLTSRIIRSEKCTCAVLVAPFLHEMLSKESSEWFIDTIATTGQPSHSLLSKCVGKLCNNFTVVYGSTEAATVSYKHVTYSSIEYDDYSIGQPVPGVEVKILGRDGTNVPRGDIGEMYVRSPIRFSGYFNNNVATESPVCKNGWLKTGDLGHISQNGDLVMDGRASEAMLIHGEVVLPLRLERDIRRHQGVLDVLVSPVPDVMAFQHACVSVVLKPEESKEKFNTFLNDLWKAKELHPSGSLVSIFPKYYLYFDQFPLNKNGKTDKKAVAAEAIDRLKKGNRI